MSKYIRNYIKDNYKLIKIVCICFILGLVVGTFMYFFINDGVKSELTSSLKNTLDLSKSSNFKNINVIKNGVTANAILVALIYFCSITLLAPLFICFITFLKSFAISMYSAVIFSIFGFSKGILVNLFLTVFPNMLYTPAFVFLLVNAVKFHYFLFEEKDSNIFFRCIKEFVYILISFSLIILSVVLEELLVIKVITVYSSL